MGVVLKSYLIWVLKEYKERLVNKFTWLDIFWTTAGGTHASYCRATM